MVEPLSVEALRGRQLAHCGVAGEREWLACWLDHIDAPRDPESFCDPAWKVVEKGMGKRSYILRK